MPPPAESLQQQAAPAIPADPFANHFFKQQQERRRSRRGESTRTREENWTVRASVFQAFSSSMPIRLPRVLSQADFTVQRPMPSPGRRSLGEKPAAQKAASVNPACCAAIPHCFVRLRLLVCVSQGPLVPPMRDFFPYLQGHDESRTDRCGSVFSVSCAALT